MVSDMTSHNVRPETTIHNEVASFANGHGPILSKADQVLALQTGKTQGRDSAHLPSNEDLLEQLRSDAKKYEKDAPKSLAGLESPDRYSERARAVDEIEDTERGIAQTKAQVEKYTPEQLKDIGDLANAAHNPAKLQEIMKRFTDPQKLMDLQDGLRLEEERRGGKTDLGTGFYTNDKDMTVPYLTVSDSKGTGFKQYDGPAHERTAADRQSFRLDLDAK